MTEKDKAVALKIIEDVYTELVQEFDLDGRRSGKKAKAGFHHVNNLYSRLSLMFCPIERREEYFKACGQEYPEYRILDEK